MIAIASEYIWASPDGTTEDYRIIGFEGLIGKAPDLENGTLRFFYPSIFSGEVKGVPPPMELLLFRSCSYELPVKRPTPPPYACPVTPPGKPPP